MVSEQRGRLLQESFEGTCESREPGTSSARVQAALPPVLLWAGPAGTSARTKASPHPWPARGGVALGVVELCSLV